MGYKKTEVQPKDRLPASLINVMQDAIIENEKGSIEYVNYTAVTSNYGIDNPTAITFGKAPRVVSLVGHTNHQTVIYCAYKFDVDMDMVPTEEWRKVQFIKYDQTSYETNYVKKSSDGKTLYVYSETNAYAQFNSVGMEYCFMGISQERGIDYANY